MNIQSFNKHRLFTSSGGLVLIYLFLAVLMVTSALLELRQSKQELLQLMESQSHSLLESLLIASENILQANNQLSEVFEKNAINQAVLLKSLYEHNSLSQRYLEQVAHGENIRLIRIYNQGGEKLISTRTDGDVHEPLFEHLLPVLSGYQDTLIFGLHKDESGPGFHYTLALAVKKNQAIFLDLDATHLVGARRKSGFGQLIRNIASDNQNIVFAALQDTSSILAASGNVSQLSSIVEDDFLFNTYQDSLFSTRISEFDSLQVFEAVRTLSYNDIKLGLFRLGLSLKPLDDINNRIIRRLAIITIILIIIGSIFFTYLFIRQRYQILQKEYAVVETYTGSIIENVSDAIIVANDKDGIRIFNQAAELLFGKTKQDVTNKSLSYLLDDDFHRNLTKEVEPVIQIDWNKNDQIRHLLVAQNKFEDTDGNSNTIILCRDMTKIHNLESQLQRKARLSAMGELAAGVAHEIRNPLNTIGTIAQQLHRDFEPVNGKEEYSELNELVISEVERINKTIQDFLAFTKPEPLNPQRFNFSEWINSIELQFKNMLHEKNLSLHIDNHYTGEVGWDKDQMRQVILNLLQNAIDAVENQGKIHLFINSISKDDLEIIIEDDGPGISAEIKDKIFNIYFSTKQNGSGIGLSIVQRIIQDHNGSISVESKTGAGTRFVIVAPVDLTSGSIT